MLLEELTHPDGGREARRPGAHDQDADVDALVGRVAGLDDERARVEGRREVRRAGGHEAFRSFKSCVSLGTISCRSPTTPRSEYSKMGAFGSLLMATIVPALCIPTLCWIAPEIPQATYSLGATVLPVCPTCVAYGYQPASTTARVAATAPPRADASSSSNVNPSGEPSPRPPATMMSASSIDGPLDSSCVCSTSVASVEKSENSTSNSSTSALPLDPTGSSAPARTSPRRGESVQPTSTRTVSPRAGRLPTSSPSASERSVRS